jgi:hypothetical protein
LNKSPIGECNFHVVDIQTAEIGIKIFEKSNRRQKIGTATIQLLSQYLIEKEFVRYWLSPWWKTSMQLSFTEELDSMRKKSRMIAG